MTMSNLTDADIPTPESLIQRTPFKRHEYGSPGTILAPYTRSSFHPAYRLWGEFGLYVEADESGITVADFNLKPIDFKLEPSMLCRYSWLHLIHGWSTHCGCPTHRGVKICTLAVTHGGAPSSRRSA